MAASFAHATPKGTVRQPGSPQARRSWWELVDAATRIYGRMGIDGDRLLLQRLYEARESLLARWQCPRPRSRKPSRAAHGASRSLTCASACNSPRLVLGRFAARIIICAAGT